MHRSTRATHVLAILFATALLATAGCGGPLDATVCEPHVVQNCLCPSGQIGRNVCSDDGSGFGTCTFCGMVDGGLPPQAADAAGGGQDGMAFRPSQETQIAAFDVRESIAYMAQDETYLYVLTMGDEIATTGLKRVPKSGTSVTVVLTPAADLPPVSISDIVVDDTYVYLLTFGAVYRVSKTDGGALTMIYMQSETVPLALAGLIAETDFLYVAQSTQILRMAKDGSGITPIVTGANISRGLVANTSAFYWVDEDSTDQHGRPGTAAKAGGPASLLFDIPTVSAELLLPDDTTLYFVGSGALWSLPVAGGIPQRAADAVGVGPITADAASLYYNASTGSFGEIIRWSKSTQTETSLDGIDENDINVLLVDDRSLFWSQRGGITSIAK